MIPKSLKPRFFDMLSSMTVRYIQPAPYNKATGLVAQVYKQISDDFFINAPMTTHAVYPKVLAGLWMAEREIVLTDNKLSREDKEALGVTISQVNKCTYCEDLLNSVVYGANEEDLAENIRYNRQAEIQDNRIRLLHSWALSSYDQEAEILFNPPFSSDEAPEVIGVALMLNYFNRYTKIFFSGTPLASPFSSKSIKSALYRLTGNELRESVLQRLQPGDSINLLEPAELPVNLQWAVSNPVISSAVSRWASAMEETAQEHISTRVRALLETEIDAWQGKSMGLSRAWLAPKVAGLNKSDTAAAQLALLTALSPAQISDDIIDSFRKHFPDESSLVITVAWSAFIASRHVAGWLADKTGYFNMRQFSIAS